MTKERICRALVAANPSIAPPLNALAVIVGEQGRFEEARDVMRRAVAAAPRDAALQNNLGNLLIGLKDSAGAEQAYRRAVTLNPDYPEAYYNLGNLLHDADRPDQALAAHRRAVALRPAYAQALARMGVLMAERGDHRDALVSLDAAVAADPGYFDAHYYRGTVLVELERFEEALAALKTAISIRPDRFEGHHALGNLLSRMARENEALDAYRRAIDAAPDYLPAHRSFNALAWGMGRNDLYLSTFKGARDRVGDKPDLLLAEAEERLRLKQADIAEELLRRAEMVAPQRPDIANALARSLIAQGRTASGIDFLRKAIDTEPQAISHRRELGVALLRERDARAAVAALDAALRLAPHDQLLLAYQSLAYREVGDTRLERLVDHDKFVRAFDLPLPPGVLDVKLFNDALGAELVRLHTQRVEPVDQTLRSGTQTSGHLFAERTHAIALLRDGIQDAVAQYIRELPDDPDHPLLARKTSEFSFAGSWSCQLRSSGYHTNHVHGMGWISSAYYVSLPGVVDDDAAKPGWLKFGESNLELGAADTATRIVQPRMGRLVLFPSYFWHGTVPFVSDENRLTVAFDVVPGAAPAASRGFNQL